MKGVCGGGKAHADAFLEHVIMSSAKLAALKVKGFGKFSVIPASCSLFLRVVAGWGRGCRVKEKPSELL